MKRQKILAEAMAAFSKAVESGRVHDARSADEVGAEFAVQHKLNEADSEELLSAIMFEAGKAFPGNWEDYPK